MTEEKYKPSKNKYEAIATHDSLVNFSNSLRSLSVALIKISNDIRF